MKILQVDSYHRRKMLFGHMRRITLHNYVQNYMHVSMKSSLDDQMFAFWCKCCCAGSKLFIHINYFVYKVGLSTRMGPSPYIVVNKFMQHLEIPSEFDS